MFGEGEADAHMDGAFEAVDDGDGVFGAAEVMRGDEAADSSAGGVEDSEVCGELHVELSWEGGRRFGGVVGGGGVETLEGFAADVGALVEGVFEGFCGVAQGGGEEQGVGGVSAPFIGASGSLDEFEVELFVREAAFLRGDVEQDVVEFLCEVAVGQLEGDMLVLVDIEA